MNPGESIFGSTIGAINKDLLGLTVCEDRAGKPWRRELEVDAHTASTPRKLREMDAGFPFVMWSWTSAHMEVPPTFRCLLTLVNPFRKSLTDVPIPWYPSVIPDLANLMVSVSHHRW